MNSNSGNDGNDGNDVTTRALEPDMDGAINHMQLSPAHLSKLTVFVQGSSTTGNAVLINSLRISMSHLCNVVHMDHTTEVLLKETHDVTIPMLVKYLCAIGGKVVVIDVYNTPIEKKMSMFLEDIGAYHFNQPDAMVSRLPLIRAFNRFNKLFPHIIAEDSFISQFGLLDMPPFNAVDKCASIIHEKVSYVKLRMTDLSCWGEILRPFLGQSFRIITVDNFNKLSLKKMHDWFIQDYKIPENILDLVNQCEDAKRYHSEDEWTEYINSWKLRVTKNVTSFSDSEYQVYSTISKENAYLEPVIQNEYMDDGCICAGCSEIRRILYGRICEGYKARISDRVWHSDTLANLGNTSSSSNSVQRKKERRYTRGSDVVFPFGR
jgi:hypothetical protein